ncbi:hypothetical protein WUBG_12036 [Wuchereria bancrofti]|uniref:Trehalose-6-phosphate synthase n=1 Tax=Wuchereria bancrofti TaxID=6293 RepID=J9EJ84_WUCBA|nr:hypothetical protein WUBG_12036 [Wuchereria bancrofti]
MDGLPRAKLVAHYLAMDVGVVTPIKDGMNLVAKEMLICNPAAALILSSGAGTEVQLGNAGFYAQDKQCYYRVEDVTDTETFADCFYKAATESLEVRRGHGILLNQYLMSHDIDEWSTAFLDPSWTHEVIRLTEVKLLADFYQLMDKTCQVRRQIAERVLKGIAIRAHFSVSLENAKASLESSCVHRTHTLILETAAAGDDSDEGGQHMTVKFDITNELAELENDLEFLRFIQSDEINNVEQFVMTLASYHPSGQTAFVDEVNKAFALLTEGDHFQHFFTDRDGTLKSYSCSYPTSIQPAYSAVIQAQFARRCAQFCAIVTTSPLMHIGVLNVSTMPEGYYAYGASAGREWYLNPSLQFKDDSVNDADLALLTSVFERLEELLEQPEYRNFTWIGSGLQRHYGHITIARQDVNYSVPKHRSSLLFLAVTNRRSVESYRVYQDNCLKIVDDVNAAFVCKKFPTWKPIKFNMDGLPRAKLVAHYLAMDVGVVTPIKDGMNLVAKEMLICNPAAALILSSGAGTEVQLGNAGFYAQDKQCYYRVEDVTDTEVCVVNQCSRKFIFSFCVLL